jgi:hypothetical protein
LAGSGPGYDDPQANEEFDRIAANVAPYLR